jgi:hypothetical protein
MGFRDREHDIHIHVHFDGPLHVVIDQPHLKHASGVNGMSLPVSPVAPGTSFTGTYTAVDADGNTLPGPITFTSSDESLLTVTGDGSDTGVSVVTCDAVAAGSPILTASFTNADGTVTSTGTNNPFTVTIAAAVDDAVAVNGV